MDTAASSPQHDMHLRPAPEMQGLGFFALPRAPTLPHLGTSGIELQCSLHVQLEFRCFSCAPGQALHQAHCSRMHIHNSRQALGSGRFKGSRCTLQTPQLFFSSFCRPKQGYDNDSIRARIMAVTVNGMFSHSCNAYHSICVQVFLVVLLPTTGIVGARLSY